MKEPRPADPLTVEAATAALAAARADLGQEEAKLGTARAALADSERELERLGDVLAAGAPDAIRRAAAALVQTVDVQRQVVAACSRRVAQARAAVASGEAARTETERRAFDAAAVLLRTTMLDAARWHREHLEAAVAAEAEARVAAAKLEQHLRTGGGRPRWGHGFAPATLHDAVRNAVMRAMPGTLDVADEAAARRLPDLERSLADLAGAYLDPAPPPVELAPRRELVVPQPPGDVRAPDQRWLDERPLGLRRVTPRPEAGDMT